MGGGDLNSKKSWHPNTLKNQERVWKAEQAETEEKKRILELQRERAEENDRVELNKLARKTAGVADTNRLNWMYDKPDKKAQSEDYLLGRTIDKNYDQKDKLLDNVIPAVARRVVGSSMQTTAGDTQVDLVRKVREDPLLLVKERERAARAALLNNPLHRRRLTELLRKDQEKRKEKKAKSKPKKKEKDLDDKLAAKLNALGGEKGIDLAALLASGESSSESSSDDEKTKKHKKKKHEKKKLKKSKKSNSKKRSTSSHSDSESNKDKKESSKNNSTQNRNEEHFKKYLDHFDIESRKRKSDNSDGYEKFSKQRYYEDLRSHPETNHDEQRHRKRDYFHSSESRDNRKNLRQRSEERKYARQIDNRNRRRDSDDRKSERRESVNRKVRRQGSEERKDRRDNDERISGRRGGMSEEEKAARLAAMMSAGAEREVERGRRVKAQKAADDAAEKMVHALRPGGRSEAKALPDSLESRIHSNRHYIQRDKRHMDSNFARR